MALPPGIDRREIDGRTRLATEGSAVYGESTADGWRAWDVGRSKLAAGLERGIDLEVGPDAKALYLGAAAGTTASHVADVCRAVFAVEFAPHPLRRLRTVAEDRPALIPLFKDARQPGTYAHVVDSDCDLLVQDVATSGQASVAVRNRQFLAGTGQLFLAIKARSEDVTAEPTVVYKRVLDELEETYDVVDTVELDPVHEDHIAVLARPR